MLTTGKAEKICRDYGIGNCLSIDKISEGVLNENSILTTTNGKYFAKSVRQKAKDTLKRIYAVESFMASENVPAVVMLQNVSGTIFVELGDEVFTIYPFIDSNRSHDYGKDDFYNFGEMLGKIHLAGSKEGSRLLGVKEFSRPSKDVVLDRLETCRDLIMAKDGRDEVDEQFLKYMDFKLTIIPKMEEVVMPNDTVTHGDYYPGNILIDPVSRAIIGVCDWEKTEFAPRSYELARAILYTRYGGSYLPMQAVANLDTFLQGYRSIIDISADEIIGGLHMRIRKMALSAWLEEKYYKNHDSRANHFVREEMKLLDFCVNGDFLAGVKSVIQ